MMFQPIIHVVTDKFSFLCCIRGECPYLPHAACIVQDIVGLVTFLRVSVDSISLHSSLCSITFVSILPSNHLGSLKKEEQLREVKENRA